MIPQNIKINNVRSLDAKLVNDEYFDYMLYKGEVIGPTDFDDCIASFIDMRNKATYREDGGIQSLSAWTEYINEGVCIPSGKTGFGVLAVDNGRYHYIKDLISNKQFLEIFFSGLTINSMEDKLTLYPVTGNTLQHSYPYYIEEEDGKQYLSLKGGFMQGFFKLYGKDYQTLPDYIDYAWNVEIKLRPRSDYDEVCDNILNIEHPENKGLFFYIGTRAENKFGEIYNGTYQPTFDYGNIEKLTFYDEEDYTSEEYGPIASLLDDEKDVSVSGISMDALQDEYEIDTDNKHIFFNHTPSGFTVNTWDHENEPIVRLRGQKRPDYKENPFLIFNQTCTGLTADKADEYLEESREEYSMEKDIIGNAFALKYNDDGSISFRYTIKDCDSESGYTTVEETSIPGLIHDNKWNMVNVTFQILDHSGYDKCGKPNNLGNRKMRVKIYVNGFLIYISTELPELYLKPLNDLAERQWGVPYNLSLGGGTQGLGERIWLDYYQPIKDHYYLEEEYAGTFIGDIQLMKFFVCERQFIDIQNSYHAEITDEEDQPVMDDNTIYYGFALAPNYILVHGDTQPLNHNIRTRYTSTSQFNHAHFYVIISKDYRGTKPVEFTCGGAPMVMFEREEEINGKKCIVYESGEIYASGTSLSILSDNI